jgi:succinyl-diaminopimelate desuccinylase
LVVSAEPGGAVRFDKSDIVFTLGRRGRVVVTIEIEGVSSHGAEPDRGVNAIDEAAKIATAVQSIRMRTHEKLPAETLFVRRIEGHSTSLSVPESASLELDVHIVPPSTADETRDRVEKFVNHLRTDGTLNRETKTKVYLAKRDTPYLGPYMTSESDPTVQRVLRAIEEEFREPIVTYGASVADDNVLAHEFGVPVLTLGPYGENEHSLNEWVSRSSLERLVALYSTIIRIV